MVTNEQLTSANSSALIWSLAGGTALAIPAGYLLAYLVALPGFLGLFFYLLIGLFLGAAMFRLGKAAVPAPKQRLMLIGVTVAVFAWMSGMVTEYRWFPADAAGDVLRHSVTQSASREEIHRFEQQISTMISDQLRQNDPPGGLTGYWRWRARDGSMQFPRMGTELPYTYTVPQRKITWLVRVTLSLVLIAFSLLSQFLGLARLPAEPDTDSVTSEQGPIQSP